MKRVITVSIFIMLFAITCYAADVLWTFDSDDGGWNSPSGTWDTTISHNASEGNAAVGSIQCTDSDDYAGVRNTVALDGSEPTYALTAWVKLVSVDATAGLGLNTWALDKDNYSGTVDDYCLTKLDEWQSRTRVGTADASGYNDEGYIMINSTGSGDPATYEWFVDDVSYREFAGTPDVVQAWTFDSDDGGWNSPAGTWDTTIAHNAVEGNEAVGSIQCTDSDDYAGVRNTVALDGNESTYFLTAWVKLVSVDATAGLGLNTWALDKDNYGGTVDDYCHTKLDEWQSRTRVGTEDASGYEGDGYIMINSTGSGDPATYEWYVDDVVYQRISVSGVTDWALY